MNDFRVWHLEYGKRGIWNSGLLSNGCQMLIGCTGLRWLDTVGLETWQPDGAGEAISLLELNFCLNSMSNSVPAGTRFIPYKVLQNWFCEWFWSIISFSLFSHCIQKLFSEVLNAGEANMVWELEKQFLIVTIITVLCSCCSLIYIRGRVCMFFIF